MNNAENRKLSTLLAMTCHRSLVLLIKKTDDDEGIFELLTE